MKRFLLAACIITPQLFAANAALSDDGFVGIYADAQGAIPCTTVPQGSGTTLYVLAKVAGATATGITGVEFRIEVSNPSGWFLSYAPPTSGTTVLGQVLDLEPANPDDGSGVNIAFSSCSTPTGGIVSLGTLSVYNLSGGPAQMLVKRHSRPSNAAYSCALFTVCDSPVYSKVCMTPSQEAPCSLAKGLHLYSETPVFVTALDGTIPGQPDPEEGPPTSLYDELAKKPVILMNPTEPDIVKLEYGGPPAAKVLSDTTWIMGADWTFDSGTACAAAGWTKYDNHILNDGTNYWSVNTNHAG